MATSLERNFSRDKPSPPARLSTAHAPPHKAHVEPRREQGVRPAQARLARLIEGERRVMVAIVAADVVNALRVNRIGALDRLTNAALVTKSHTSGDTCAERERILGAGEGDALHPSLRLPGLK
eukprot:949471-Prymnesium_polylepis.1